METNLYEAGCLIELLKAALSENNPKPYVKRPDWDLLLRIAKFHSVANTAYYGLIKYDENYNPPSYIVEEFKKEAQKAMARESIQHFEGENILNNMEQNQIACLPLKGWVIKYLYPRTDMRSMSDVDILFEKDKAVDVRKLMTNVGYTTESFEQGAHDIYYKLPHMNLEMHRDLIPEVHEMHDYFNDIWSKVYLKEKCNYIYEMKPEDYYIFLMAHLTKHYSGSGTGIRSIMDVWIYLKNYQEILDWQYIEAEFDKLGIRVFGSHIKELAIAWFDEGENNELCQEMTNYIISNGTYGISQNSMNMSIIKMKNNSFQLKKFFYFVRRIFPEKKHMQTLYPVIKKASVLMPVFWVIRLLKTLLYKQSTVQSEIKMWGQISKDRVNKLENLHSKAGLKNR